MTGSSGRRPAADRTVGAVRWLARLAGVVLLVAPLLLSLQFSGDVGDAPDLGATVAQLALGTSAGVVLGAGPLLAGVPAMASGAHTPGPRLVTGALLVVSAAALLAIGVDGAVTRWVVPGCLVLEIAAFVLFVFPATGFAGGGPGRQASRGAGGAR